jgi:hypothetical protein
MALDGGGGGGGLLGVANAFTGPAQGIEIAGDFAYAYSGLVVTTDAEATLLEFQSGNFLFVGTVQFLYAAAADTTPNVDVFYKLDMNGSTVISYLDYVGSSTRSYAGKIDIIIPAYTEIKATANMTGTATQNQAVLLVGRIYR